MKKILTVLFFMLMLTASAQDFSLFNLNSKKVFKTQDALSASYSLAFDSLNIIPAGKIYYPYRKLNSEETQFFICEPWGGGCYAKDVPVWIGDAIIEGSDGNYTFFTQSNDTLNFDFTLAPLQSHIFYEDQEQRFSLSVSAIPLDTMHFDDFIDTVKRFQISHTDLQGNVINSPLNNHEILIGNELGLISFFRIDSFPQVLVPLDFLGNENPPTGLYQLTNAIVFDHQPGDEIQYYEWYYYFGQPAFSYKRYTKHTFLDRSETADSIYYIIKTESFKIDSTHVQTDTINMWYLKNEIIADIPFDFQQSELKYNTDLLVENHLDESHWSYKVYDDLPLLYCEDDNLWCQTDNSGFQSFTYVPGLGLYDQTYESVHTFPYSGHYVIYYKKNGVEHGSEAIVGISAVELKEKIKVIPNPVYNQFRIEGTFGTNSIVTISNSKGQHVLQIKQYQNNQPIDVSMLLPGIYIINVLQTDNVYSSKLIVK